MKRYVHCNHVNSCSKFPNDCSPLCDDFLGYACMGDEDKMNPDIYRQISEGQLIMNSRRYEDITGDF